MPILSTGDYFDSQGCNYSAIEERAKLTGSLSGKVVDVQKEYGECVRRVMQIADEAREAAEKQQTYNQIMLYIIVALSSRFEYLYSSIGNQSCKPWRPYS